jgi:predicted phosphodiesterase
MLVCSGCKTDWRMVGSTYPYEHGNRFWCKECNSRKAPEELDVEMISENTRLAKQKQGLQDRNRIERKAFREHARIENAVSSYAKCIELLLEDHGATLAETTDLSKIESINEEEIGVIQITDTHFNELVDLPHNKYDFSVASHRLFKLVKESKSMFGARGINKVVVAFTGDLMNSDRRLDELLNMATNRAKATFVAVELIKEVLVDLQNSFNVSVVSVLGNESRVKDDMSFASNVLSDNYDFTIVNMVRLLLQDTPIKFSELGKMEMVVDINGHKVLVTHDIQKATNTQKNAQSTIGRYHLNGNPIDCIIGGHLHSTKIEHYSYRSQSLVGSNEYNENALNLSGRAGQNIYFFGKTGRHAMSVDLQDYNEGECYDINTELAAYDCKSHDKTKKTNVVFQVVI